MKKKLLSLGLIGFVLYTNAQENKIESTGNVGIGTINPTSTLAVIGENLVDQIPKVLSVADPSASNKTISMGYDKRYDAGVIASVHQWNGWKNTLIQPSGGNVGIGTTNPSSKLAIVGENLSDQIPKVLSIADPSNIAKTISLGYDKRYDAGVLASVHQYTGWKNTLIQPNGGNVGIGTVNPNGWKLAVNGKIRAKEIKVETGWSDFVFFDDYKLPTLQEVENHIKENGHLKDIPSAKEVEEDGIFLGELNSKLLQKIEELTLYTIQQEKKIKKQTQKIENLESLNEKLLDLQSRLEKLESK